jgi:hypothetical protein
VHALLHDRGDEIHILSCGAPSASSEDAATVRKPAPCKAARGVRSQCLLRVSTSHAVITRPKQRTCCVAHLCQRASVYEQRAVAGNMDEGVSECSATAGRWQLSARGGAAGVVNGRRDGVRDGRGAWCCAAGPTRASRQPRRRKLRGGDPLPAGALRQTPLNMWTHICRRTYVGALGLIALQHAMLWSRA